MPTLVLGLGSYSLLKYMDILCAKNLYNIWLSFVLVFVSLNSFK